MKISTLFILAAFFTMHANNSYAQRTDISLNLNKVSIGQVLDQIESTTEFQFVYKIEDVDLNRIVSVQVDKEKIDAILNRIFAGTQTTFNLNDRRVYLVRKSTKDIKDEVDKTDEIVPADQFNVSGTVKDNDGNPLPGASIVVKGTTTGTTSDFDGNFEITVPNGGTLVISYVGFSPQEIAVNSDSSINVVLQPDSANLDEVVVIGYGTRKKSDITGSVASVKAEEIAAFPILNAAQAIQGRAPGVDVQSTNGDPGALPRIRIRGTTSVNANSNPLFVIDGFIGGALPPAEDIASLEVLKDASATAIYGSRGANGVVIVTTKKGAAGRTNLEINISESIQSPTSTLDLLKPNQFVEYVNEVLPASNYTSAGGNSDWQDLVFRDGRIRNIQLSVSGGSEKTDFYVSGTIFDQDGLIINSDFKRFSMTSNINSQITKRLKIGANIFVRRTESDGVTTQEATGGANGTGVIAGAYRFQPDLDVFNEDGEYNIQQFTDPAIDNPVAVARERINNDLRDRLQSNFYGEFEFIEGLSLKSTLGFSVDNRRVGTYNPTTLNSGRQNNGNGQVTNTKSTIWLSENYLTFKKDFDNQSLEILGGYSYQSFRDERYQVRAQNFISDSGNFFNLAAASEFNNIESELTESELTSLYGRVEYSLLDKYLFTFNARYDGSSVFSEGNKYGFFPSGAFAWNMKNENFLKDNKTISQWKWRVSYGRTGNAAINAFGTLAELASVPGTLNSSVVNAVIPSSVANENLEWEFTDQLNIGLDLGFFNNRLSLTADYYDMLTSNLLFSLPLPQFSGFSGLLANIGEVSNKGFELGINTRNIVSDNFSWSTTINFSTNKNRVEKLPEGGLDIIRTIFPGHMQGFDGNTLLREGEPLGVFYGYIYDGVYQEGDEFLPGGGFEQAPGGEKFRDIDGTTDTDGNLTGEPDGMLNGDDRTIIGDPNPDFIWSINNDFRWKNFDLNVFFQGTQGNDIYSFTLQEIETLQGVGNTSVDVFNNRWTPTNTDTNIPAVNAARGYRSSSRYVRDGSYIRLRNVALGYNFPKTLLDKLRLNRLRIYMSAQNLFTITDYDGYDPEVNYTRNSGASSQNLRVGYDYGSYPIAKTFTWGLNIGF